MDTDLNSAISAFLSNCEDHQLFRLTRFYKERLEQAIEEGVERVSFMLMAKDHFTGPEYHSVTELAEKGNRAGASKLLLDLVMEKGSGARRVMWESFVKLHHHLPKLSRILNEIRECGDGQFAYMDTERGLSEVPRHLKDVRRKHMETLWAETEKLRVNTILMREKVKVFQLVDRYAELTVISTVRDRRLVEHELLARGRDHEEWREKGLRGKLEKIRTDQLFKKSFVQKFERLFFGNKSGMSAAVAGVPGIGKTTMVQKIVYDWATGKIYQQFQFVFSFKFRDLNTINCRINLKELILYHYPYFGNILGEVWKQTEGLLFVFDGLDEFKDKINFVDGWRDTEPQYTDPEFKCKVSDIVYSLIQHKLLPGCSVLVTTRPTALHLLEKADISVWAEILGFVGEERKEYFIRYFEDQTVAEAVFKHMEENEILYTMSYNPSYCWILALVLGPFFTQRVRDPQRVPKTITQLYSYYIYNILKNHGRDIENPRDVLLRVGQMAFRGVSERKIVFTDGDLINYNLQPSQFLSGFLMELLEREDSARSVVYTFPHLTIQEFVAAVAQFLNPHPGDILKFLTETHNTTDGRFEVFLRFVAGLSSPMTARGLEEFLGPFPHQTTCRVIDWVKEEVKRQSGNTESEAGKRSLLNTLHYLFESQNRRLAQAALGSVKTLSFSGMTLTPIDCAVLSHVIGYCDTIKHLDLGNCHIQCEGIQRLGPGLHKCQELSLGGNDLGDSGVKLVSTALRNPECKIQRLGEIINNAPWFCYPKPSYFTEPAWVAYDWFDIVLTPFLPFGVILPHNALTVRHILVASRFLSPAVPDFYPRFPNVSKSWSSELEKNKGRPHERRPADPNTASVNKDTEIIYGTSWVGAETNFSCRGYSRGRLATVSRRGCPVPVGRPRGEDDTTGSDRLHEKPQEDPFPDEEIAEKRVRVLDDSGATIPSVSPSVALPWWEEAFFHLDCAKPAVIGECGSGENKTGLQHNGDTS
ncbi:NACHT, LRR and PYD domains-containing protein 3-like [Hemitrygon akajei]|uniref:NACHT, LRR and PYD domains-containing protein 3-like n=1 Tax=Hemitrygon akajei TaxID=2704970 RepID=UPI003BFA2FF8